MAFLTTGAAAQVGELPAGWQRGLAVVGLAAPAVLIGAAHALRRSPPKKTCVQEVEARAGSSNSQPTATAPAMTGQSHHSNDVGIRTRQCDGGERSEVLVRIVEFEAALALARVSSVFCGTRARVQPRSGVVKLRAPASGVQRIAPSRPRGFKVMSFMADWAIVEVRYLRPRRFLVALGLGFLMTAAFAGVIGWGVGGELTVLYVDDLATAVAALGATILSIGAGARQRGADRRFWWLLAAACAAWTLGEAIWAVYDLALREAVPVPSWADLGYLGAIPFAVGALLCHPGMMGDTRRQVRSTLDGLLVATALLCLSWSVVLGPLWHSTDLTTLGGFVAIAYPFGDVVIVFFVVLVVRHLPGDHRLPLWCLLGGLLALALSDSVYAYLTEVQGYETGGLLDTGWFAGYVAIAVGAFCAQSEQLPARHADSPKPRVAALVIPFVPILGALGVVGLQPELVQQLDPVALASAFALVALVLARQLLVLHDIAAGISGHGGTLSQRLQAALGVPAATQDPPPPPPPSSTSAS